MASLVKYELLLLALGIASLGGCAENLENKTTTDEEYIIKNLDLTKTEIKEYRPTSGDWEILTFDVNYLSEKDVDNVRKIVEDLDKDFDINGISFKHWTINNVECTVDDVSLDDMSEQSYLSSSCIKYDTPELCMYYYTVGQNEIMFPQIVENRFGISLDNRFNSEFFLLGENYSNYDILADKRYLDKELFVGGAHKSIKDINNLFLAFLKEKSSSILSAKSYDYELATVYPYKYDNGEYGVLNSYRMSYDGVPVIYGRENMIKETDYQVLDNKRMLVSTVPIEYQLGTFSGDSIDFIWSSCLTDNPSKREVLSADAIIDYEKACSIVSKFLAQNYVFCVDKVTLQYAFVQEADTEAPIDDVYAGVHCGKLRPVWTFQMNDINWNNRIAMTLDVLADTGEICLQFVEAH